MKNERITEYHNLRKLVHRIYCEDCNVELEPTGIAYYTYPEQYEYMCPCCNKNSCFNKLYPYSEIVGDEIKYYSYEEGKG